MKYIDAFDKHDDDQDCFLGKKEIRAAFDNELKDISNRDFILKSILDKADVYYSRSSVHPKGSFINR